MKTITILPSGEVEFMGELPIQLPLEKIRRWRVSVVRPSNVWKRIAFISLRLLCRDTGRVAAFTRTWSGKWTARILATGETQTFNTRAEAIAWEIEVLNQ